MGRMGYNPRPMAHGIVLMNTKEAAAHLGLSIPRIKQLIRAGRLPAEKVGRDWVINLGDLERFAAQPRRPGGRAKPSSTNNG